MGRNLAGYCFGLSDLGMGCFVGEEVDCVLPWSWSENIG